jgi:WD40 repeat protein/serine/threonine protein kinase
LTADAPLHPDMRLLRDFAAGALDGHELDRVVEHLEQCGTCRAEVDGIATGDGLLDRLRQAATLAEGRPADHTERRRRAWALRRRIHRDSSPSAVSTAEPGLPIPPQDVANYEILREVGRGGMGVVYLARHRGLRRLVALKMILAGGFASEAERQRFQREAELAARVQHPNIVQVYEAGVHDGHPFLAMEWVSGITLADRIGPDPWPWHDAARLMETLALAIDAAHRKGVIHRDLKPSNILLQTDADVEPVGLLAGAVPKIADFGLARPIDGGDGLTSTGLTLGTPEYMAPEQANSGAAAGPGADVYALGAVLYQLLTARLPFMADTPIEILQALTTTEPVAPRRLRPSLPRDLETIVLKAIEKEPARRYATAGSMAEDLHRFLVGEPILAHAPTALTRLVKWAKRRPSLAALTVTLAAVTVVAFTGITALWVDATQARDRARAAAREAETRGDAERRALYQVAVAAAASELELNNLEAAQDLLEAAPEEYRNWEWQHFAAQFENAQTVFRTNEGRVSVLGLAPSGKLLAYATSGSHDVRVRVPGAPADLAVLRGGAGEVTSIAFSPDGSLLAVGATDRTVRVWSITDSREAAVLAHHEDAPLRLVMAPDGSQLVACCKGGSARVWELAGGSCLADIKAHDAQFSPDGRRLLTVHAGTVHLRDATTGESLRQWADPQQAFTCAVLSPDGRRMATGSIHPANRVCLWDVDREGSLVVLEGHKNTVFGLVFSHDGRMLASRSADKTVRLWDTSTAKAVAILREHRRHVTDLAFSPDGRRLVTATQDRAARVWDTVEGTPLAVLRCGASITAETAVSQDGSAVAMADETGAISFWFVDDSMRSGLLTGHTGYVYDVTISRDGRTVASAAWDGTVRLWDAEEGRESLVLRHSGPAVTAVAISPDGRQVVSIAQDGVIRIWDSVTGRLARSRQLSARRDQLVEYRVAYSPLRGLLAATGGHDKLVQLIDANTGELAANLAGHETEVSDATFSPDGNRIASADCGGTVLFWTTADSVSMATIKAHDDLIHRIAFSPDGGVLATASQDRTVRLWDITTRRQLATLRHGTVVFGLAFNPDGSRLATACDDGMVRLWDVATFRQVAELSGHGGYVHAVAFSADGNRLISGSGDYTVRVWDSLPSRFRTRTMDPSARD